MNVCHYFFEGGKLKRSQLCGRYGCREENYIYKENALTHIEVKQYDIEGNSGNDLIHIFQYQDDGALESITKSFPNGYSEIIYKTKRPVPPTDTRGRVEHTIALRDSWLRN